MVCEKPSRTVVIPGVDFDCGTLLLAQAQGDATVLAETGQPVFVAWTNTQQDTENLMAALQQSG
jgi:hypothetical protein